MIRHEQIAHGAHVEFEMSDEIQPWGNDPDILKAFVEPAGETREGQISLPGSAPKASIGKVDTLNHDEL